MKFGFDWPTVLEKKMFENGGQTTEHGYTISSPCEPDGSGVMAQVS